MPFFLRKTQETFRHHKLYIPTKKDGFLLKKGGWVSNAFEYLLLYPQRDFFRILAVSSFLPHPASFPHLPPYKNEFSYNLPVSSKMYSERCPPNEFMRKDVVRLKETETILKDTETGLKVCISSFSSMMYSECPVFSYKNAVFILKNGTRERGRLLFSEGYF